MYSEEEEAAVGTARGAGSGGHHVLVVGAGISGATIARRAAEAGKRVLVVEARDHVAGNCHDAVDRHGLRVSTYGPHFFHTNDERVWAFVRRFATWLPWEHRVTAAVAAVGAPTTYVPVPVNRTTVNTLFGLTPALRDEAGMEAWLDAERVLPAGGAPPSNSAEVALQRVGPRLYDLLFRGYSVKQWELDPSELAPSVLARIPVRTNEDDRYFTDAHQALPKGGYTAWVASMLDHPNIEVRTGCDYFAARGAGLGGSERTVFTGPIDAYYVGAGLEPLQYRSVRFEWEERAVESAEACVYPTAQVNFPSPLVPHTRVTEYKHILRQRPADDARVSVLAWEYSQGGGEPYYPVPTPRNAALYDRYAAMAAAERDILFVGRLATYKYLNMDQAIGAALRFADEEWGDQGPP